MKRDDIVLLSTADWNTPFWTNKQHITLELTKRGHKVLYVDSLGVRNPRINAQDSSRIAKRLQNIVKGPRQVDDRLWIWSPFVIPLQENSTVRRLNQWIFSSLLKYYLSQLGFKANLLWTYHPLTLQLLNIEPFTYLVYHCVDDIKAQPGMLSDLIFQAECQLVKKANIVFTTSPKLTEVNLHWNKNTHYFSNVADFDLFSKAYSEDTKIPDDILSIPGPRIGFIGAISDYKVDFKLLEHIARVRPNWSLVLIGKVGLGDPWTDVSLFNSLSNVHLLGPRPYKNLPSYLKAFDVAILPNQLNEYTESMFPMKFFEYLAAGKPVVSANLPALQAYKDVAVLAESQEAFVAGIEGALEGNIPALEKRLATAQKYTYASRMEKMMHLIETESNI